jgi:hypothetical protein
MYVRVDIDPDDILSSMDLDEIVDYLKSHYDRANILKELKEEPPKEAIDLADSYWHGDLDLSALLKELGPQEAKKIFQETLA